MSVVEWVVLVVVIAGTVIALFGWDRYRGKRKGVGDSSASQPTGEVFIDPETGRRMRVWDDHGVPDLVVPEQPWRRVGPPLRLDNGAHRVEAPHRPEQQQLPNVEALDRFGESEQRQPPQHQVRRGNEAAAPLKAGDDGQGTKAGPEPERPQHDIRELAGHAKQAVRGGGGGDEDKDHLVVGPAHTPAPSRGPSCQVVARAHRVQPDQPHGVYH